MNLELEFPVDRCDTFEDSKILFDQIASVVMADLETAYTHDEIESIIDNNLNLSKKARYPYAIFIDLEHKMPDSEFLFGVLMEYVASPIRLLIKLNFINGGSDRLETQRFMSELASTQKRLVDCLK